MTGGGTTDSGTTGGGMTAAGMTSNVTTGGVLANVIMVNICSDILETEHTVLCGIYTSSYVDITRTK